MRQGDPQHPSERRREGTDRCGRQGLTSVSRSWSCASVKQSSLSFRKHLRKAQAVSSTDDEKLDFHGNFSWKTRCWQRLFKIPDEKVIIHDESSVRLRPLRRFQSRPPPTENSCTSGGVHWELVLPLSLLRNQRPATTESDTTTQRPLATARRAAKAADILLFWSFLNDMENTTGARALRARCSLHDASGRQFHLHCLADTEVFLRCKRTAVALRTVGTQQLGPCCYQQADPPLGLTPHFGLQRERI